MGANPGPCFPGKARTHPCCAGTDGHGGAGGYRRREGWCQILDEHSLERLELTPCRAGLIHADLVPMAIALPTVLYPWLEWCHLDSGSADAAGGDRSASMWSVGMQVEVMHCYPGSSHPLAAMKM